MSSVLPGLVQQSPEAAGRRRGAAFPEPLAWQPVPTRHQREPVKPARGRRAPPSATGPLQRRHLCPDLSNGCPTLPGHGWAFAARVYIVVFVELRPWLLVTRVGHSRRSLNVLYGFDVYPVEFLCRLVTLMLHSEEVRFTDSLQLEDFVTWLHKFTFNYKNALKSVKYRKLVNYWGKNSPKVK